MMVQSISYLKKKKKFNNQFKFNIVRFERSVKTLVLEVYSEEFNYNHQSVENRTIRSVILSNNSIRAHSHYSSVIKMIH